MSVDCSFKVKRVRGTFVRRFSHGYIAGKLLSRLP